jgi:hypothetical protein
MAASLAASVFLTAAEADDDHVATDSPIASTTENRVAIFMASLPIFDRTVQSLQPCRGLSPAFKVTERFGHAKRLALS